MLCSMIYMNNIAFSTLISMNHHLINNVISNIQKNIGNVFIIRECI